MVIVERRQFIRKDIRLKVICQVEDEEAEKIRGHTIDISLGGIGMSINKHIASGKRLLLSICGALWTGPIRARGEVVWQSPPDERGVCRTGIRFLEIPWTQLKQVIL